MSVKVMNAVFERYPSGGGEMLLALALADHAHDDGTHIWPSVAQLAEKTRQSERSVQYQLRKMEESGWLILVNSGNGGRSQRREYRINLDWIKGAEIAPIEKGANDDKKGATGDGNGAIDDMKGCNGLHPHITVNNHQESSSNHQQRADLEVFALPDWIPQAAWNGYLEMRKKNRKVATDRARDLVIVELKKLKDAGQDVEAVLDQSTRNNWTDVYPLKGAQPTGSSGKPEKFDPTAYVNRNRKRRS